MKNGHHIRTCTGCGSTKLSAPVVIPGQPVIMNYRFPTAASARKIPRRSLELVECRQCGLIYNQAFDEAAVPYDENYENRQDQSPVFARHTEFVARWFTDQMPDYPRILEVGCGKGIFLKSLVSLCRGTADGYDTSYEGPTGRRGNITFHRSYVRSLDVRKPYDAVVCRHVVEHVAGIGQFLGELRDIAAAAGDPVVFLETPRLEWIIQSRSAWDIFHEHCNYFTEDALRRLVRLSGFRVLRQRRAFGGQYQLVSLRLARKPHRSPPASGTRWIQPLAALSRDVFPRLAKRVERERKGGAWAIWGAGAKGMCLANRSAGTPPVCLFDMNPAKQGIFVPGAAVPVVEPTRASLAGIRLVVIVNPTYQLEIQTMLSSLGYAGRTLTLESE